jgi:hypothetical protein
MAQIQTDAAAIRRFVVSCGGLRPNNPTGNQSVWVGKGAKAPCPPSIRSTPREWWARFRLRSLSYGETSRFAYPTDCELICFARKRNLDAQLRQINTTGKSVKTCPAIREKIFRLTCRANQSHNSARLTADEGRWPSSRTRGEMRWTRELRLTCVAQTYGEVVWS